MRKLFLAALAAFTLLFTNSCSITEAKDQLVLKRNNTIVFNSEVNDSSVAQALQKAMELDAKLPKNEPLYLILYTPGGSVQAGLELIDGLRGLKRKVHTITIFAASMGFQIAQNLDNRYITSSGVLMSHRASGGFKGEFGGEANSQIENRLSFWLGRIKEMDLMTVKRSKGKQTLESYTKSYENELWISGYKSVEQGYADSVVSVRCEKSMNGKRRESIMFFGIKIDLVFSECPLIMGPLEIKMSIKTKSGYKTLPEFYSSGGVMGTACTTISNRSDVLCPEDITLTEDKINQISQQIVSRYTHNNKTKVVGY